MKGATNMTRQQQLVATALLVLLLSQGGLRADDSEDLAVKAIKKLGGEIYPELRARGEPVRIVVNGWKWLRLVGTDLTDAGLKELSQIKSLLDLNFAHTKITDAGLRELKE